MRGISFERFFKSQKDIEGAVEGKRRTEKAKKEAANNKEDKEPQILHSKEEVSEIVEGLASGKQKAKKEYFELEEEIEKEAAMEEEKRKKENPKYAKPESKIKAHRQGFKPPKVERDTIRESHGDDTEEAA